MSWSEFSLSEVSDVRRGTTITQLQTRPGNIPVVAGGMTPTYFHDTSNRSENVITVSSSGASAGYVNFWTNPIFASDCSTVTTSREDMDIKYVYYFLRSQQDYIYSKLRSGAAQPHVYAKDIAQLRLQVPPIDVQRRTVAILDQADALRAKRREALAQLGSLMPSIFIQMFGDPVANPMNWPVASLTDVCHCYSGGTPSKACPEYWQGTLPWFSAKDLKADDLFDSQDHIEHTVPETTNLRLLPSNTIAFCVRGMILAHTFQVSVLRVPATINQDLKALFPKVPIETEYLAECIRAQSNFVLQQVSEAGHGTKRLDALGLREIRVLQPPESLQKVFASHAHAVRALKNHHSTALAELDTLFASLQHRAFRGEL
ncbi:restriction endonuclease subunit S [Undibacterium sp.]|uniref:restriction endonuclease subunit S n=1 Tax=Undibacterium sp. TaxID=1914977 RepID=UPI0025F85F92|nr:restriction endonuclease subunit S [Undibacterium sp.]